MGVVDLKDRLKAAVSEISESLEADDLSEHQALTAEHLGDIVDDLDGISDDLLPVISLNDIPVLSWDAIKVSASSTFGCPRWDFSEFPHVSKKQVKVNWDYSSAAGIRLTEERYLHWLRIVKVLTFYSIPHFSVSNFVRSYGSLNSRSTKARRLLSLFDRYSLYLGKVDDIGYRTINDLSPDQIIEFINGFNKPGVRWEIANAIQFWQKLSRGNLLPPEYAVKDEFVSRYQVAHYRAAYDAASQPFEPIDLDDYAAIISHCVAMVEEYSKDVLWLYENYYSSIVGGYAYPERASLRSPGFSPSSEEGVNAFLSYCPVIVAGNPWWPIRVRQRVSIRNAKSKGINYVSIPDLISVVASMLDAACVIILATTGMRRSEVMDLRSGCVSHDETGYWLRFRVFKTSVASQGDVKKIPIPDITAKAISVLEQLCHEARIYGQTDKLFVTLAKSYFGLPVHGAYPERAVKRVALAVDASEAIHPHRFRKSLAIYLVYQDPKNIEIIRHLFSHASLKMTLRYVMSLPGLNDEIKKIITRQNVDVLLEVLEGALNGKIGGKAGKRLSEAVENSPQFIVRLQDKGKETLIQYVESMLDEGIKILHRTNLAICMKTPGHREPAPCDARNDDPATKLHPNLFACEPFSCRFAAFVESNIPALESEIIFHNRLVAHQYVGDAQRQFSKRRIEEAMRELKKLGAKDLESIFDGVQYG